MQSHNIGFCFETGVIGNSVFNAHLQDSGLLLELLILVRVGIRKLVDFDPALCNLIQDLARSGKNKKDMMNW